MPSSLKFLESLFFTPGESYLVSRWIFVRGIGIIYLIAFISLWVQVHGLIGSKGILPVSEFLGSLSQVSPWKRFYYLPTVFWANSGDLMLHAVCGIGVALSVCVIIGTTSKLALIGAWILYLSLTVAGQEFLSFQWDVLLLEAGFLAILVCPFALTPFAEASAKFHLMPFILVWWLVFRLMFESGVVKLSFGDSTWINLRALSYHYYTQPLPMPLAWLFHQFPAWVQKLSVLTVYFIEIALPFLIFINPQCRLIAFIGLVSLQILILATGNYGFFNFLSIVLCGALLSDQLWSRVLPQKFLSFFETAINQGSAHPTLQWSQLALLGIILLVTVPQVLSSCFPNFFQNRSGTFLERALSPFRLLNAYGLFRVMTTERSEIVIEASQDGENWKEYIFRYKPQALESLPRINQPHQPRLDWQMWFAALSHHSHNPWFHKFLGRLLEGSDSVTRLLKAAPYDSPPKYIRALVYRYQFTSYTEKKQNGHWWKRELVGSYLPTFETE